MNEAEQLRFIAMEQEKKLKELMGEEAYTAFAVEVARAGFRKDIEAMPDGEFKTFCLEHFDEVTQ